MQSKRAELVPVAEVVSRLGGPVAAIRDTSPQALHHFTQADQVNQLVGASEADPALGFMARLMTLCSLPRTNPGDQHQYTRQNGPCISLRKPHGPPCRKVVNRDSFRDCRMLFSRRRGRAADPAAQADAGLPLPRRHNGFSMKLMIDLLASFNCASPFL